MMHSHGNKDSLVYWLEFKNDDELPGVFGSIAGGSALKFGIYRKKATGIWMTGSPSKQIELSVSEAIDRAHVHRDMLVAGSEILSRLPNRATDREYFDLQKEIDSIAPKIGKTAWVHKYFSLLYPEKLDDYHTRQYQDFHLIRLLQKPPGGNDQFPRYAVGGIFVRLAHELGWPMNHITSVLNRVNGRPYGGVWRVGTDIGYSIWPMMQEHECVAIGWPDLGDLSNWELDESIEGKVKNILVNEYGYSDPRALGKKVKEIGWFASAMEENDPVVAANGQRVLGLGRIKGKYQFNTEISKDAPHQRTVEWLWSGDIMLPQSTDGLRRTVSPLKSLENHLDVEKRIQLRSFRSPVNARPSKSINRLDGIPGRIQSILEHKGQVILYGPPGTGKTYWALKAGRDLAALNAFGKQYSQLSLQDRTKIDGSDSKPGLLRMCTFHPAYGYEDFLEGYRPSLGTEDSLNFRLTDGIFKKICSDAIGEDDSNLQFFLIIDEINRGDIPRIFGELLTLLENDKRGQIVDLPVSGKPFLVPKNVRIIGTMNTADRSIALLDTALRRRFGFIELMPDSSVLQNSVIENYIPLGKWLDSLNDRVREHIGRDARNLQIGHSYFMRNGYPLKSFTEFVQVLDQDVIPLLEEYCYEDYSKLADILGPTLVDVQKQRIRRELLEPNQRDTLVQALLAPSPDLTTSSEVVTSKEENETSEDLDDI